MSRTPLLRSCETGCRGYTTDPSIGNSWTLLRDGINSTINIRITRSFHSADCDTDDSLACSKVQLHPKKLHLARNPTKAHINVVATVIPGKVLVFQELLQTKQHVKGATHDGAMQAFGKKEPKSEDVFDTNIVILLPLIQAKRAALQKYQRDPTPKSLDHTRPEDLQKRNSRIVLTTTG